MEFERQNTNNILEKIKLALTIFNNIIMTFNTV